MNFNQKSQNVPIFDFFNFKTFFTDDIYSISDGEDRSKIMMRIRYILFNLRVTEINTYIISFINVKRKIDNSKYITDTRF